MIFFMLRSRYVLAFVAILVLAAFLRFYKLGEVPHGMTWDEAAIGYNSYAIWNTRRDEWLEKLPVSFKSFGDHKAPFAIYLLSGFTGLIDLNLWVVRMPFAAAGVMAVLGMILLTDVLLALTLDKSPHVNQRNRRFFSLSAGFFLATSPWHLHFSRAGFESGLALTFVIWAVYFFLKWLQLETQRMQNEEPFKFSWSTVLMAASAVLFALSMYTYHSAKGVAPALIVVLLCLWWRNIKQIWKQGLAFITLFGLSIIPLLEDAFLGKGGERYTQTSVLAKDLPLPELIETVGSNFFLHFKSSFLLMGETTTLRHGDGIWGVLFITTYLLAIVGLMAGYIGMTQFGRRKTSFSLIRVPLLALAWLGLGMIPAAVGVDVPHSNRALLALPGILLLAVWGLSWLCDFLSGNEIKEYATGTHGEKNSVLKLFLGLFFLLHMMLLIKHQQHYYTIFASESAEDFKDGYLEAFEYAIKYEKGLDGVEPVNQIVFTTDYGQAYIYALFARKTNPIYYQGGSLNKYLFVDTINIGDLERENVLIVASPNDPLPVKDADHLVYGSDGEVRFKMYLTR